MSEFNTSPELVLFPAIDLAGGKAVRLVQGEADSATNYGDPVDAAEDWIEQGAEWIHLVDLDAAFGRGENRSVIKRVIRAAKHVNVELSGGIRDDESLERAVEAGASRINLGTAALENPEWAANVIARYGELIAVGLDVRGTTLAARGWTRDAGDLWTVLERLEEAGCARYVVTDVTKDGTLQGPNLQLLSDILDRTDRPVVASGGISSLDDLVALRGLVPQGSRARLSARHSIRGRSPSSKRSTSHPEPGSVVPCRHCLSTSTRASPTPPVRAGRGERSAITRSETMTARRPPSSSRPCASSVRVRRARKRLSTRCVKPECSSRSWRSSARPTSTRRV